MRKLRAAILRVAFSLTLMTGFSLSASSAPRKDCSCRAPDGSCSANVSCRGECDASCGPNGNCMAYCTGYLETFGRPVHLQLENATYGQIIAALARVSGKEITFSSPEPEMVWNLDIKGAPLWNVLETLSEHGTVQVAGVDFNKLKSLRRTLLSGEKISWCLGDTSASSFVQKLRILTGLPLRITGGDPATKLNLELTDVTLEDIIRLVSEQSGVTIIEEGADQ